MPSDLSLLLRPTDEMTKPNDPDTGSMVVNHDGSSLLHIQKARNVVLTPFEVPGSIDGSTLEQRLRQAHLNEYIESLIYSAARVHDTFMAHPGEVVGMLDEQLGGSIHWIFTAKGTPAMKVVEDIAFNDPGWPDSNHILTGWPTNDHATAHMIIALDETIGWHYTGKDGREGFLVYPRNVAVVHLA